MKKFPENDLFELDEDENLSWKSPNQLYVKSIDEISDKDNLINILKEFVAAGGAVIVNLDINANLALMLTWYDENDEDDNSSIQLGHINLDFYNKLRKIIQIDTRRFYNEIAYSKKVMDIYESLSDEEKLEIEIKY